MPAPVRVTLDLTPEQFARLEALMEKIRQVGAVSAGASRAQILLAGLEKMARGTSNNATGHNETISAKATRQRFFQAPFQVHVHRCPECGNSSVQTSRGELELGRADARRVECDSRVKRPGRPNIATIPPSRRSEVLRRDRYRCRAPGCNHGRFLEVHHVNPRSRGGGHELENLVTLCSGCHRLHHEGRLRI